MVENDNFDIQSIPIYVIAIVVITVILVAGASINGQFKNMAYTVVTTQVNNELLAVGTGSVNGTTTSLSFSPVVYGSETITTSCPA